MNRRFRVLLIAVLVFVSTAAQSAPRAIGEQSSRRRAVRQGACAWEIRLPNGCIYGRTCDGFYHYSCPTQQR